VREKRGPGPRLVDHLAPALSSASSLDRALKAYARAHRRVLYSQHVQNTAFSASPALPRLFQAILAAVPHDAKLRRLVALSGLGRISQRDLRIPLRLGLHYLTRPLRGPRPLPKLVEARYGAAACQRALRDNQGRTRHPESTCASAASAGRGRGRENAAF
jgi:hypothetical protein